MNSAYKIQLPYESFDQLDTWAAETNSPWQQVAGMAIDVGIGLAERLGLRACFDDLKPLPREKARFEQRRQYKIPRSLAPRLEKMVTAERVDWQDAIFTVVMAGVELIELDGGYGSLLKQINDLKIAGWKKRLRVYA